ncbi:hypothetical protein ASD04_03945 [Devosia sp. Root436]|nr:hypothetical protein ASD04_03945 [Devosia sp. Root436]
MTDDRLTDAQDELHRYMSDISELAYCASWMDGTEYRLWAFMTDVNDDGEWGNAILPPDVSSDLLRLSRQVDGWIYWADAVRGGPSAGPAFVSSAEWQRKYARPGFPAA